MKNITKRIACIVAAMLMICTCVGTTAFAAEPEETSEATCYNVEFTSDGVQSITDETGNAVDSPTLLSTISGYGDGTLTNDPDGFIIYVDSSGWGGMGVTVKASSSWNGYMSLDIVGEDGSVPAKQRAISSNGETYLNDLFHYNPAYYLFSFRGIPSGQSVYVQIWVYG